MDIGGIKTKIQQVLDAAEQLYAKMNEVVEQLTELTERLEATDQRLMAVERRVAEQRALVEALAEREGIDADAVLAEADLPAEPPETAADPDGSGTATETDVESGDSAAGSGRAGDSASD